jgi:subfamily B ATP-binding cassette protein MsbA
MARVREKASFKNLFRFYRLVVPYWRMIALAVVGSFIYSALGFGSVLLIGPIHAAFQRAGQAAQAAPEKPKSLAGTRMPGFVAKTAESVKEWFGGLRPVQAVKQWLWTEASLKRVAFVLAFIIGPLFLLTGFLQDYAQARVVWSVTANLRQTVFDRISRLSLSYFSSQRIGELISRLTIDINRSEAALSVIFGTFILQPLMLAFFLVGALATSVQLTLIAILVSPAVFYLMARYGIRVRQYATKNLARLADVTDSVTQMLNGIRVVKSFYMEEAERKEFAVRNRAQLEKAFKLVRTQAWAGVLPEFLLGIVAMSIILLTAHRLLVQGKLSVETMTEVMIFMALVGGRVRRIVRGYVQLQQSLASVNRVFELVDTEPDIEDAPDAVEIDGVHKGVRYNGVWFAYDQTPVLKGIELDVPVGKTYAIVGETGAGKSTMLDLIPRFYDAIEGSVSIDGVDVRRIKRESLMRQIAIVGQRPFLFNRAVAENIRCGKPDATDEEVYAAAKAANIHNFIMGLPQGYQTLAGEAGDRFSGGQRQCITIARAILKNAPILILDEATSSLDAESEMLVQQALQNLMKGRTTLVIAHRLSTVRHADRIVVLKDGRIVEEGSHSELLQLRGEYQRLYRLQFADEKDEPAPQAQVGARDGTLKNPHSPPTKERQEA